MYRCRVLTHAGEEVHTADYWEVLQNSKSLAIWKNHKIIKLYAPGFWLTVEDA